MRSAVTMRMLLVAFAGLVLLETALAQDAALPCIKKPALSVVLTAASSPDCYSTEIGAMWTVINIVTYTKCYYNYTITGVGKDYDSAPGNQPSQWRYPASPSVMYVDTSRSGQFYRSYGYVQTQPNTNQYLDANSNNVFLKPDFNGLTKLLVISLPQLFNGPFGPSTNIPVPYSITAASDKGGLTIVSPSTKCTFTYRVTSGSFAGLKPIKPAGGSESTCAATAGFYQPSIAGAKTCAVCPAGTFSASGAAGGSACKPCSAGGVPNTAAGSAGSGQCQTCEGGLKPDVTATSCVQACDLDGVTPTYGSAAYASGNKYNAGSNGACNLQQCPNGTIVNAKLTACLGVKNGQLCQFAPGGARVSCGSGFKPQASAPVGGAALTLLKADTRAANCAKAVAPLASWLMKGNRVTWMGYDLTGNSSATYLIGGTDPGGVTWQVLGPALPTSILQPGTTCGNAHGGPGPQPAFTQSGIPLDSNVLLFNTILENSMPLYGTTGVVKGQLQQGGWGIIATAGSDPGTITTTWFQDSSFGTCGISSVTAQVPSDTCTLTFKVAGGSILGVSASPGTKCPSGTHPVTQPDKSQSCIACAPGYAFIGGKCKACSGNFYQPTWGDVSACKPCKGGGMGTFYDGNSNWYCFSDTAPRFKDN